jgi:pyridoxine 5-phosphate synthase
MTRLSVNLNKVALLRNARPLGVPSVTHFAAVAIEAGARGITVHPRPDQRHIRGSDIDALSELLAAHPHIEFNIEGNKTIYTATLISNKGLWTKFYLDFK